MVKVGDRVSWTRYNHEQFHMWQNVEVVVVHSNGAVSVKSPLNPSQGLLYPHEYIIGDSDSEWEFDL